MKQNILVFLLMIYGYNAISQDSSLALRLWYDKPAGAWEEALPLGNATTGAMVFGGVVTERFQLNDHTLWSGYPDPGNNPNGPQVLPQMREQIFNGNYDSAATLWKNVTGPYSARYLPLADLWLRNNLRDSITSSYYRDLDLKNATSLVKYTIGDVTYLRETFISHPDKVMVVKLTASKKGALNFTTALTSKLKYQTIAFSSTALESSLFLKGKAPKFVAHRDYEPEQVVYDDWDGEGMNFEVRVKIVAADGAVATTGSDVTVSNATTVTIYLSEATSYNGFDKSPGLQGKNPAIESKANLAKAVAKSYEELKTVHIKDYQSLFGRVQFQLGESKEEQTKPTDERLKNFALNYDNGLVVLYYQFGRYLMISGSRPGSLPTNLQGIWNELIQPPWGGNYTTNINVEMNYWPAENTNLSECQQPLFDWMKDLAVNGAQTAKINYNIHKGWLLHHNSDVWAKTSPAGGLGWDDPTAMPLWGAWTMGGAWLSKHLWEHYLYTGDRSFLVKEAYPLMKGAAEFVLQWLIVDPKTGYLITNPSTSPENKVKINDKYHQLTLASTMDMSLARELFTDVINASAILRIDQGFRNQLIKAKAKLYPFHIGQYGQLQEWVKDWDDPNDKHRHISHLFGLFPGNEITLNKTPELAAAAKKSLIQRGDKTTGWSMAWKINCWARLHDGEQAGKILSFAFDYTDPDKTKRKSNGGGTYPNLFNANPPFQIDGNFGATAGITEMLLQSHDGAITLLPALPPEWQEGSISGLKARGNFSVDMAWQEGKLSKGKIYSVLGGNCRIRTYQPVKVIEVKYKKASGENPNELFTTYGVPAYQKNASAKLPELNLQKEFVIDFATEKGKIYTIIAL